MLFRGKMSGNIKLSVNIAGNVCEMCLFSHDMAKSHKVCSEIIQVDTSEGSLAYVVSLEKIFGIEDICVIRLVHIEKADMQVMSEYSWNPEAKPQEGSTQFTSETMYLVKKADRLYCRVQDYEILNTEVRTQLFMHSYGYIQSSFDFGNVRRYMTSSE